jgi:LPS sulfotransferase NodH
MNRTQLAELLKSDRKTIRKYLSEPGAPKPDDAVRYSVEEVREWVERLRRKTPATSDEYKELSLSIRRMEAEDMALDLKARRGELVEKVKIRPTIAAVMSLLTENLRNRFEQDLPGKYEGKTTAERMKLNAEGVDFVLGQFKAGPGKSPQMEGGEPGKDPTTI